MNTEIVILASVALMLFGAVYRILFMPFNGQPGNKKRKEQPMAEKNALAELARRLAADADVVRAFKKDLGDQADEVGGMMMRDIRKASRIVAELAKASTCEHSVSGVDELIANCGAIAKEGAGDGK